MLKNKQTNKKSFQFNLNFKVPRKPQIPTNFEDIRCNIKSFQLYCR